LAIIFTVHASAVYASRVHSSMVHYVDAKLNDFWLEQIVVTEAITTLLHGDIHVPQNKVLYHCNSKRMRDCYAAVFLHQLSFLYKCVAGIYN